MAGEAEVAVGLGAVEAPEPEPVETPEVEAPEAGSYDWSQFGEGVDENIAREAINTYRSLDTEEGATDFFVRAGIALGLSADQMVALFDAPAPVLSPEEAEAAAAEEDRPLTKAEVLALIEETAVAPMTAAQQQAQVNVIQGVIQAQQAALEIPDASLNIVLGMADQHLTDAERLDPKKVEAAIGKAHEAYSELVKSEAERYLGRKAEVRDALPTPMSGGGPSGGEEQPEPQSVAEASARVREALRRNGAI